MIKWRFDVFGTWNVACREIRPRKGGGIWNISLENGRDRRGAVAPSRHSETSVRITAPSRRHTIQKCPRASRHDAIQKRPLPPRHSEKTARLFEQLSRSLRNFPRVRPAPTPQKNGFAGNQISDPRNTEHAGGGHTARPWVHLKLRYFFPNWPCFRFAEVAVRRF